MLSVSWNNLGKRFGLKWIFRNLQGEIPAGSHIVIKGNNGSGKSTFGKLLVGATDATKGEIIWSFDGELINIDDIPQRIAWSAPFMEVNEEMKIREVIEFHNKFRKGWNPNSFIDLLNTSGLKSYNEAQIKTLSSGQKQRLRLILALGTKANLVVLDEPCSNLDSSGIQWYGEELVKLVEKTTVVVCSNNRPEEHLGNATEIHLS